MNYQSYLKSDSWKNKRKHVLLNRKSRVCDLCRKYYACEVHHREGYRNLGNESLLELSLVCRNCHKSLHFTKKGKKIPLNEQSLKQRWHELHMNNRNNKTYKKPIYPPLTNQEKEQLEKEKAFAFRGKQSIRARKRDK